MEEEDKTLWLITLLHELYEHLMTMFFYEKDTVELKKVTTTLLSNGIRRKISFEIAQDRELMVLKNKMERYLENGSSKRQVKIQI